MAVLGTLTACGNESTAERENYNAAVSQKEPSGQENQVSTNGKVLVAYFSVAENSDVDAVSSASVSDVDGETKGRMTALAEMIQEKTGGELFSIKTSVKYPGDGGKLIEYAQEEQDKDERPEITSHIDNLDDYQVIFVGFPDMVVRFAADNVQFLLTNMIFRENHYSVQFTQWQPVLRNH